MKRVTKDFIDAYDGRVIHASRSYSNRVAVGIPMTGIIRCEWMLARYGQVIPCNWSQVEILHFIQPYAPVKFQVADARNIIATTVVEEGFEWLFFIDHDVMLTPTTVLRWNAKMLKKKVPVWSGLYFTKSVPSEPLVYRGRGNSYYTDWKIGDEVWADGIPMGCTVIHSSILKAIYKESESYKLGDRVVRKIFNTPAKVFYDPENNTWFNSTGTEDLEWCNRVIDEGIFKKAGWPEYQKRKYPFLIDTNIFCKHIDFDGTQYPSCGEETPFIRKK